MSSSRAPSAWDRAGSWRASCRTPRPSSATPCRASTSASSLEVVPDLRQALVFKQRPERVQHLAARRGRGSPSSVPCAQRHVPRAPRRGREARARRCPHAVASVLSGSTRSASRGAPRIASTSAASSRIGRDGVVLACRQRRPSARTPSPANGTRAREQLVAALAGGAADTGTASRSNAHRHVSPNAEQLTALRARPPRERAAPRGISSAAPRRRARAARRASPTWRSDPCAPFSPMPGTPLMLSMESPISASTSTTCSGRTPHFSLHAVRRRTTCLRRAG